MYILYTLDFQTLEIGRVCNKNKAGFFLNMFEFLVLSFPTGAWCYCILLGPIKIKHRKTVTSFWICEGRYCWWLKSCTSWYVVSPIIYRVLYIPGGAGFLPSTVSTCLKRKRFRLFFPNLEDNPVIYPRGCDLPVVSSTKPGGFPNKKLKLSHHPPKNGLEVPTLNSFLYHRTSHIFQLRLATTDHFDFAHPKKKSFQQSRLQKKHFGKSMLVISHLPVVQGIVQANEFISNQLDMILISVWWL